MWEVTNHWERLFHQQRELKGQYGWVDSIHFGISDPEKTHRYYSMEMEWIKPYADAYLTPRLLVSEDNIMCIQYLPDFFTALARKMEEKKQSDNPYIEIAEFVQVLRECGFHS